MDYKNTIKRNPFTLLVASLGIVIGLVIQCAIWWNTGYNNVYFEFYSLIMFAINGFSVYYLFNVILNNREISGLYALLYISVLFLTLQGCFEFYIVPRIEKHGKQQKAIITEVYKKSSVNGDIERGVIYKYSVNNKVYMKSEFSDNLKLGDSIKIKFFVSNPTFHINYIN